MDEYRTTLQNHRTSGVWRRRMVVAAVVLGLGTAGVGHAQDAASPTQNQSPRYPQFDIPRLTDPIELRYRFPDADAVFASAADRLVYRVSIRGHETIQRGGRESRIEHRSEAAFDLAGGASGSEVNASHAATDLRVVLTDLLVDCDAGAGSFKYDLDADGLTISRPGRPSRRIGIHDDYVGSYSVASLLERAGVLRLRNGALLERPSSPALLLTLDAEWLTMTIPALLPPLPTRAVEPGAEWTAGAPAAFSTYANWPVQRIVVRFESYDFEAKIAEITWRGEPHSVNLRPTPGIHHIRDHSVASGTIAGRLQLALETGRVLSSRVEFKSRVERFGATGNAVLTQFELTMEPGGPAPIDTSVLTSVEP
ncbi:MAG: hypothetical protein ACF8PN_06685 [Phycisphaerales bacterium]